MLNHAAYANSFDYELDEMSIPLHSSNLCCIRWDDAFHELEVHFVNGARYTYFNVPRYRVRDLLLAPSAGHYFSRRIKPHYVVSKGGLR